jgi:hypothetical protein
MSCYSKLIKMDLYNCPSIRASFLFLILVSFCGFGSEPAAASAGPSISSVRGVDLFSGAELKLEFPKTRSTVVVFLSATCPCSDSHIVEIKALHQDFPEFDFVGIHSNSNEKKLPTQTYFQNLKLPFSVIRDREAQIADLFKASKTPHAFVISATGQILYRGGVSSSSRFHDKVERKFLREALEDLKAARPVRVAEGRTLGCAISRGEKNEW